MNFTVMIMMMLLSGLSFQPSCSSRFYILVKTPKTWTDAQSYCRSNYANLATVQTEKQLAQLNELIGSDNHRWSLENQTYYGAGEADFRNWDSSNNEPNNPDYYQVGVALRRTGKWADASYYFTWPFICYNGKKTTAGKQNSSMGFIFVNQPKTWTDARSYCRQYHTDLASVRDQSENDYMTIIQNQSDHTWIGLFRDSWKWSDGSPLTVNIACVASNLGKWTNINCSCQYNFVCFEDAVRKQVLQVVLEKTYSSVDMEDLKEDVLQKFDQILKEQGLNEDIKLSWVKHSDEKTFHKISTKKDKDEKDSCPFT
ncbi:hypothetical protein Q8A73_016799 [Channa argus]|nr:hypothetical protein Q8A73_016799 [Channa argus]